MCARTGNSAGAVRTLMPCRMCSRHCSNVRPGSSSSTDSRMLALMVGPMLSMNREAGRGLLLYSKSPLAPTTADTDSRVLAFWKWL